MRSSSYWLLFAVLLSMSAASPPSEASSPNVVIILADDLGFSDLGCYGGEIETPNLDRLAADGLRFTNFHNTARCWPTRACIMTGYYAQQVRMDPPKGRLPDWTRLMPHYLKPAGYRCYHSGKWHVRGAPKVVADGGFDRSYLVGDQDRFFSPTRVFLDDKKLPPVERGSGYYATRRIADYAVDFLGEHEADHDDEPFLLYLAFTCPHFPLHALQADIDRYRDLYQVGWDTIRQQRYKRLRELGIIDCELSAPEPETIPRWNFKPDRLAAEIGPGEAPFAVPWNELTAEQKDFQATKMAIHAAMVDRMDQEIGRVLKQLETMNALDDTAIFFLSDNGASAEQIIRADMHDKSAPPGSAGSYLCLGPGWSTACNTPFRRHKSWEHEGGNSTPMIAHWPEGIKARGQLRHTAAHCIDFVPTVLELAEASPAPTWNGLTPPPMPSRSLVPAFAEDCSIGHERLYFHHDNNRALLEGDWKLVSAQGGPWELYNVASDRAEEKDLATTEPERVARMAAKWEDLEQRYRKQAQE
jgi:arylsulfatase A-like enzyme